MPIIAMTAEGAGTATAGDGFFAVMEAAKGLVSWGGDLFTTIIENPVLVVFVAASFVSIGLGIVKKLKHTTKG